MPDASRKPATYTDHMDVVVSDTAKEFVRARGGTVYVKAHAHTCCSGTMTLLDVNTKPPKDASSYVTTDSPDVDVKYRGGPGNQPHQLMIEVRGVLRQHLVAYWDGCAFKPE
jgi:hypothetical protein